MQGIGTGRCEYRMGGWQRVFYSVLGAFLGVVGLLGAGAASTDGGNLLLPAFMALFFTATGLYLIALALRSRLVIEGSRIEVRGAFREQSAELDEIEGFRTISTRNGSYWKLQLKLGRSSITIQKWFDCDELRSWFQQLVDLDERDGQALLEEIQQSQELGSTPEERLGSLKTARTLNIALSIVAIAVAVAYFVSQGSVKLLLAGFLAVVPFAVLYLINSEPLLYALGKPKKDPRTDTIFAFLASAIGLMLGGITVHFVSLVPLLSWMALVLVVLCGAFFAIGRRGPRAQGAVLLPLIFGAMYAFGLVAFADTQLDKDTPTNYRAQVLDKHITKGKSTNYYLDLAPWGPFAQAKSLNVPISVYDSAEPGDTVCLVVHPGALHAAWYRRVECGRQSDSQQQ